MSQPASSQEPGRRRKQRLGSRGPQGWGPGEEAAWARPPSPRRSRWEGPGPADWGPAEPPAVGPPWEHSESGGSFGQPPRQWVPGLGGGRWRSPERTGGGRRRTPSPRQGAWGRPEALHWQQGPDGDTRAWGDPGREGSWERFRNVEGPAWEQGQGSSGGAGGWWDSAGRRSQSPSRERQSLGSSGRDIRQEGHRGIGGWNQRSRELVVGSSNGTGGGWGWTEGRGREHHSPTRKQGGGGSPKREKHSGSTRHHARELGQINPDEAGSRWSSAWCRERNYQNRSGGEGSLKADWQNPDGEARGQGGFMRYRGVENLDEGGAERGSHERGGEQKGTYAAGSGSPKANASLTDLISGSYAVPKEWTPRESVVQWWMQCRNILHNKAMREQLMSICPRPTLPDRLSETPQVNPDILSLLNKKQEKELRSATHLSRLLHDEVLDMMAPALTIYEMAEEAVAKAELVDPMELREWSRHLIRFLGSINQRLTMHRRSQVLGSINPRLKVVVSKMSGESTEGMLFAEDKVNLLKEIIVRFPQLSETKKKFPEKKFHAFAQAAYYRQPRRRPLRRCRPTARATGQRGTADQRVEQSHSQGAGGQQGPAEGPGGACGVTALPSCHF